MSDGKFFSRGKVHELQQELQDTSKDSKNVKRKQVLKKIIANMTMGNDMSSLSTEMIGCLSITDVEIKKMVYLFIVTYCKLKPELAIACIPSITRDTQDDNPLVRSLAIRNMSNMHEEKVLLALCEPLRRALADKDPYVAKTAAICVAKLFGYDERLVRSEGLLDRLVGLLNHGNANVVANAVASLMDIAATSDTFVFSVDVPTANRLLSALDECSEWSQSYLLEAIMTVCPDDPIEVELLAERISPRLQHANSGVVISAVRIIIYLSGFLLKGEQIAGLLKKCGPPLVTLLHNEPEIQFVALKNIQLIIQKHRDFLRTEIKVFFCKYNDPIYVKLAKLEVLFQLADASNVNILLSELKEYASEIDVDFVRKAVRAIGKCAIKIEECADKCVEILVDLIQTKVDYVVQEAVVVIKDIFRKYPNRFESIIRILCENLGSLEEPEAKASMIWIIGQYSDRIENADQLLTSFLDTFKDEASIVQLGLLTAIVKLFIKRPASGQALVPRILKYSTEEVENPDLRDRGFMYWRLLSTDPMACKAIVCGDKPAINTESDIYDPSVLSKLLYNISTLSSLSHRPTIISAEQAQLLLRQFNLSSKIMEEYDKIKTLPVIKASPVLAYGELQKKPSMKQSPKKEAPPVMPVMAQLNLIDDYPAPVLSPTTTKMYGSDLPMDLFSSSYVAPITQDRSISPDIFALQTQRGATLPISYGQHSPQAGNYPSPQANTNTYTYAQPNSSYSPHNPFAATPVMAQSPSGNPHNPFGPPRSLESSPQMAKLPNPYMNLPSSSPVMGSGNAYMANRSNLENNTGAVLDPFAKSSSSKIEDPKILLMNAQAGRGLEVYGAFVKRNGIPYLDMALTNKGQEPLQDFAILLNKNTFALVPAQPLLQGQVLYPSKSLNASIPLKIEGLSVISSPANNIQAALKTNTGIVYFQTLLPLSVMFRDGGGVSQDVFLQLWREVITTPELRVNISLQNRTPLSLLRTRLEASSFNVVAERLVDSKTFYYGSCTLLDDTIILAEIAIDLNYQCSLASKTQFASHFLAPFNTILTTILQMA